MTGLRSLQECSFLWNDQTKLCDWSETWNPFLNEDQYSILLFTTGCFPIYSLNDKKIAYKSKANDLDLIISANFQWHLHYQMISSEAYKILGLLCTDFSSSVFLCLYQQSAPCIYSLYCSVVSL